MRTLLLILPLILLLIASPSRGGDKELLDKFKKQNNQAREMLLDEIKLVLERAKELEKDDPVKAIGLLQDTREKLLQKGLLTAKEDRLLAEPLWEKIQVLRGVIRARETGELRGSLADFKEYLARMNEEFTAFRKDFVPPTKEAPPGAPAFFALANGTFAVGWLHEPPLFVVHATINDEDRTFAPGVIAGVHSPFGFFAFQPEFRQFVKLTNAELFRMAIASHGPARKSGFWMPSEIPPPPPGFFKRSVGTLGVTLFSRGIGGLMAIWAGPGDNFPDRMNDAPTSATAKLYREVMIDLQVQDSFHKLKKDDQARLRNAVLTFLDRRPKGDSLSLDEIIALADTVAEIFPELRGETVAFAHVINRFFEKNRPGKK